MTRDVLRRWLREAYDAGFAASGEGWNAEYPFGSEAVAARGPQGVIEHQRRYDADSEKALDAIVTEIPIEDPPESTATPERGGESDERHDHGVRGVRGDGRGLRRPRGARPPVPLAVRRGWAGAGEGETEGGVMWRAWWRRWTGLAAMEQYNDALDATVQVAYARVARAEAEAARERSRVPMFDELVAEKDAEIQRLIREVGSLERQLRERGERPVTSETERPALESMGRRLPSDDPLPPPTYRGFREAAADLVDQPAKVRTVLDAWWARHPRPKN